MAARGARPTGDRARFGDATAVPPLDAAIASDATRGACATTAWLAIRAARCGGPFPPLRAFVRRRDAVGGCATRTATGVLTETRALHAQSPRTVAVSSWLQLIILPQRTRTRQVLPRPHQLRDLPHVP